MFLENITFIIKKAGQYILSKQKTLLDIQYKSDTDFFTNIDKDSEAIIVSFLKEKYPNHSILSEEGLNSDVGSNYKWIIDPIDGTINFKYGLPYFSISIGLEYMGEIIFGAIYDPNRDELFYAMNGKGSFLNGERIFVNRNKELKHCMVSVGGHNNFYNDKKLVDIFLQISNKVSSVRKIGSSALTLCYIANGWLDAYLDCGPYPWDMAAGSLIIKEAGGRITNFNTNTYSIYNNKFLSSNYFIYDELNKIINEVYNG